MKRDMELVKKILLEIEKQESGHAPINIMIEEYTQEQINCHVYIMMKENLIEGIDCTSLSSKSPEAMPTSLTWSGHEFLDKARNDTVWKKAMDIVQEKGGTITVTMFSQLLTSLMKAQFGLS